jgi:polysaccharide export outer membrane protein
MHGGFMKKSAWTVAAVILICFFSYQAFAEEKTAALPIVDYVIGPGDVLDISVWKEQALTKLVTVLPDGKISFPLVGAIRAGGKTLDQLSKELENKLSRYVPDLSLSVLVHQVNSMMVYVIGKVNKPGRFILNSNIDVMQALAMAGGLNPFAEEGNVKIFRKTLDGKKIIDFDYDDVANGKKMEQNIMLERGDVIVVP